VIPIIERHKKWNSLSDEALNQMLDYLPQNILEFLNAISGGNYAESLCLVHGDLTEYIYLLCQVNPYTQIINYRDHVLLNEISDKWELSGILDWADSKAGLIFYEIPAIFVSCFCCDSTIFKGFVNSYGISYFLQQHPLTINVTTQISENDHKLCTNFTLGYISMVFLLLFEFNVFSETEGIFSCYPELKRKSLRELENILFGNLN